MAGDIGINFKVDAQTDGLKRAAGDFAAFQSQLAATLGVTDPEKAEEYWQEYNSGLEKAVKLQDQMTAIDARKRRAGAGGGGDGGGGGGGGGAGSASEEDDDGKVLRFPGRGIFQAGNVASGLVGGSQRNFGSSLVNTVEGLAQNKYITDSIATAWGGLSGASKAGIIGAMVGVAGTVVANKLSETYEAVAADVMSVTAALRTFGRTTNEQSELFRATMTKISDASAEYGYTFKQGAALVEGLARGGAIRGTEMYAADRVMDISRGLGYSQPATGVTELATMGARFGITPSLRYKEFGDLPDPIESPSNREAYASLEFLNRLGLPMKFNEEAGKLDPRWERILGMSGNRPALQAEMATTRGKVGVDVLTSLAMGSANNLFGSQRTDEVASGLASMLGGVMDQGFDLTEGLARRVAGSQNWLYQTFGERGAGDRGVAAFNNLSGAVRGSTSLGSETDLLKFQAARTLTKGNDLDALMKLEEGFSPELFETFRKQISGASEWDQLFLTSKAFGVNLTTARQMLSSKDGAGTVYEGAAPPGSQIKGTAEVDLLRSQEKIANQVRQAGAEVMDVKAGVIRATSSVVEVILGGADKTLGRDRGFVAAKEDKSDMGKLFGETITQMRLSTGITQNLKNGAPTPEAKSVADLLADPNTVRSLRERWKDSDLKRVEDIKYSDGMGVYSSKELGEVLKVLREILARPVVVEVRP